MEKLDYVEASNRNSEMMAIYRQLKRLSGVLKIMNVRAWRDVDISAAKILRLARKEKKVLKKKRDER